MAHESIFSRGEDRGPSLAADGGGKHDDVELGRILDRHATHLLAIAERVLGSPDLARDALQEALLALWREPKSPPNLRGWLARAVLHRSLHQRRSESRRLKWEQLAGEHWADICPLCDPERDALSRELKRRIDAALDTVSTDQRVAFALRAFEGLDYAEIAERTGVPIGTVRSRLNRARAILREELGES